MARARIGAPLSHAASHRDRWTSLLSIRRGLPGVMFGGSLLRSSTCGCCSGCSGRRGHCLALVVVLGLILGVATGFAVCQARGVVGGSGWLAAVGRV